MNINDGPYSSDSKEIVVIIIIGLFLLILFPALRFFERHSSRGVFPNITSSM